MIITCPCCAARFSIEAAFTDDAARRAVAAALKLPAPLGELILRYLALFRPAERALSWDRASKLLNELLEPIQAAQVQRHGRAWAAPLDTWKNALEQMLEQRNSKLQLPLKNHHYLFEIVSSYSNRAEGKTEREADQQKSHRHSHVNTGLTKVNKVINKTGNMARALELKNSLTRKINNDADNAPD